MVLAAVDLAVVLAVIDLADSLVGCGVGGDGFVLAGGCGAGGCGLGRLLII